MKHDIFISHSSKNFEIAAKICEKLEDNDIKVWIAPRDLRPGKSYPSEIVDGISNTLIVLLLFTEESYNSDPVRREIERAIDKKKAIINFRLQDLPLDGEWQYLISTVHWLNATDITLDQAIKNLVKSIKDLLNEAVNDTKEDHLSHAKNVASFNEQEELDTKKWLKNISIENNATFFQSNSHKYNPKSYVKRESFHKFFELNKRQKLLFILGEAGMGKTNEVCNILSENSTRSKNISIAFNSQLLDDRIDHHITSLFNKDRKGKRQIELQTILSKINQAANKCNDRVFFIFDAVNEATSYPVSEERLTAFPTVQLLKDINKYIIQKGYENISIVCSCRTTPFEHLKNTISTELCFDIDKTPAFFLEQYTNNELSGIFERYRSQFNILTSSEEFRSVEFSKIRNSLSSPLLFKLVAQSYKHKALPGTLDKYDFVEIVKKLLSQNLYESNFKAYEVLLRLTLLFRKKHIDQLSISKIILSDDKELKALKNDIVTPNGKISETCDILFRDNHLRYSNGAIRFAYEKVQEALFEISFLDEHESKYERHIIPAKVYEEIILTQRLDYDVVSYSYLCNALVSNFLKTKDSTCLNDIVFNPNKRIQVLTQMLLEKLSNIGYESTARSLVKEMLLYNAPFILDSALNTIDLFFKQYDDVTEYNNLANTTKSPLYYFIYLFNNSSDDRILNKAGVFLYNIILQNQHLAFPILNELYTDFLQRKKMNLNFLMFLGLLSFLVAIDTLVDNREETTERKKIIANNILNFWTQIMNKIFATNSKFYHPGLQKTSAALGYIPPFLRNILLKISVKFAMLKYFNVQTDYVNNLKEYNNFWQNIPAKSNSAKWTREKFALVAELYDCKKELSKIDRESILEGIKTGDAFSFMMLERLLIIRGLHDWNEVKYIVKKAVSMNETDTPFHSYIKMSQSYVLFHIIDKSFSSKWSESANEEIFSLLQNTVEYWAKDTYGRFKSPYIGKVKTTYGVYKQFVLNWYIIAACKKNGGDKYSLAHLTLIKKIIDEIVESKNKDIDLLFYTVENISVAATNLGKIYSALAIFDYIITKVDTEPVLDEFNLEKEISEYKNKKLDEYMISVFNTMKSFFPEQTAHYEAEYLSIHVQKRNPLAMAIQSKSKVISVTEETLGSLLTNRFGNFFVWGLNDPDIRSFFVGVLKEAKNKRNDKEWAFLCIQNAFKELLSYDI
nr:toll/interleukin-1 receptor domain-containing protein [uncultured Draconibacterium sp.]